MKMTPVWKFWNPTSGSLGGVMFSFIGMGILIPFIHLFGLSWLISVTVAYMILMNYVVIALLAYLYYLMKEIKEISKDLDKSH